MPIYSRCKRLRSKGRRLRSKGSTGLCKRRSLYKGSKKGKYCIRRSRKGSRRCRRIYV